MKNAIVTADSVSVRSGRGAEYMQLGTYDKNNVITVLDNELNEDYTKVIWAAGYVFYNNGQTIKFINEQSPDVSGEQPNAVVTAQTIEVRKGKGDSYAKLGEFTQGESITVLDNSLDKDYVQVVWQTGYAYSAKGQHLKLFTYSEEPNAAITANRVSVRAGRGSGFAKLGEFVNGDRIVVLDDTLQYDYAHTAWLDSDGYAYCDSGAYISFINSPSYETNAIVTANRISVRTGRGVNYEKLGEFVKYEEIIVLDSVLDYDYVRVVWKDTVGYAYCNFGEYIKFTIERQDDDSCRDMVPNAVVTANVISVREGRGVSYKKLGEFNKGDEIIVTDKTLDYEYVAAKWDDIIAYAYCDYGMYIRMKDNPVSSLILNTLNVAKTCVGGKYIFGAQGSKVTTSLVKKQQSRHPEYFTNGRYEYLLDIAAKCEASGSWSFPDDYAWDCSGLWWYCANEAGIYGKNLDTTANTFYHSYCVPITKTELQPGDAVFNQNSSGKVTHMGFLGVNGVVFEAMSGYTGVIVGDSVNDRTAPKIVGSGNLTRSAWNKFGRPKIFLSSK